MGYPKDLLSTRAIIDHGRWALIPPEGRVNNSIPPFPHQDCRVSVLADPRMGASFAFYTVEFKPGGKTEKPMQKDGIESFVYCRAGQGVITVDGKAYELVPGAYIYAPASCAVGFENTGAGNWSLLLYKQRYKPLEGYSTYVVTGNLNEMPDQPYDGMESVRVRDLLPNELGFDFNIHTLKFYPDGMHPFVETHVQEHGIYFLEGEGMYLLDDQWLPVKADDFVWFGSYVPQACYCIGRGPVYYIYSKDMNRDVEL
ncbi:MAG: cupin domain-containing protein [Clostridia bacterium]|nr:cupin domain-containing protein [Clostridia bacterium]